MKIERIRLKNFRVFQSLEIRNIPALAFFIGANGVGKSTLFKLFGFLKDALENNVRTALQREGGYREWVTRGHEKEPIEIEIQFRLEITGANRLVTYLLVIGEEKGRPIVLREILRYKRSSSGAPYHFLDFSRGVGTAVNNEEDFSKTDEELNREQQTLTTPDSLAIKGVGQFQRFKAAHAFSSLIENWHVSDFHIMAARQRVEAGVAEHLSVTGDNLPLVVQHLYENHRDVFDIILDKMRRRVPGIANVEANQTIDGHVVLSFRDGAFADPFMARNVSDGTLKMFAYLVLLHDPKPHPFLCIEEPENQLYPELLNSLAEELRDYACRGGQVFVSTHAPELLDSARIDEVFWLEKADGVTKVRRANDDPNIVALVEAGDPLGVLWSQGMFSAPVVVQGR
ncbi:MAG: AAA family ATPase [Azospira sp.]|jgi:predicted ATPase|nr:AAA family ATPase [Azospira sp.]